MYAVIKTGGKQYKVKKGDIIDVELLKDQEGPSVEFREVLLVADGKEAKVGGPTVDGFIVKGEILGESADPKIDSLTYKRRKGYVRRFGHRQHKTRVEIKEIAGK